jgi:LysR family transcriptional activator of dmlA
VYPTRLERSAKVRVCVDFLQEHFRTGWMAQGAGTDARTSV